jgi:hypothetical protein
MILCALAVSRTDCALSAADHRASEPGGAALGGRGQRGTSGEFQRVISKLRSPAVLGHERGFGWRSCRATHP